jgi:uncharacterized protein
MHAGDFEARNRPALTPLLLRKVLWLELLLLFFGLPAALAIHPLRGWPLPVMWALSLYCYLFLRSRPDFPRGQFWSVAGLRGQVRSIMSLFLPAACVLSLAVYFLAPRLFLNLPRRVPLLWAAVMIFYPLLSVIPQTLMYRAYFFQRYRLLFPGGWPLLVASAMSFSWLHLVLRNPVAPLLTLPAGLLFAWRYARTNSVLASAFEHALYGCLVFTLGLGVYFYTGAAR